MDPDSPAFSRRCYGYDRNEEEGLILTNEKYTGISVYGETESAEFPSTKRKARDPFEVHRSRNHHLPIIHERHFKRVQKLKAKRSNIEVDEHVNKVRKSTYYSSKKAVTNTRKTTKPQNQLV